MIPTSVTNSPPPAGLGQNGAAASLGSATAAGGGLLSGLAMAGISGCGSNGGSGAPQNNYSSVVLGLASLILEGRPIADDEYAQQQVGIGIVGVGAATGAGSGGGRLSPRPSTSRAAINITTNPYGSMGGSDNRSANGSGSAAGSPSSSLTHQRWTQKLCQLRQISPAAQTMSAEPELVSLAINELNKDHGDYEIVRRVMLNRAGGLGLVSGPNGGGGVGGGSEVVEVEPTTPVPPAHRAPIHRITYSTRCNRWPPHV
ncbi:hypothetical protein M5D96_007370 [Drosophila gunungcola]|uniref:Uncharacterized protein n=1 Tax=Drosophila gunungcola TaxID=103775 RepID=A0A9P9YNG2_9MUSC|nr:hypothetical protein M5D96_007370 [Drosophila gunungcola]